jgi:hypothetical protein
VAISCRLFEPQSLLFSIYLKSPEEAPMRKRTLASVCSVLALVIVLAMAFLRVKTPHNIPFFVIYLVLMPLLLVLMTV